MIDFTVMEFQPPAEDKPTPEPVPVLQPEKVLEADDKMLAAMGVVPMNDRGKLKDVATMTGKAQISRKENRAIQLANQGLGSGEIARAVDVNRVTVINWLKKYDTFEMTSNQLMEHLAKAGFDFSAKCLQELHRRLESEHIPTNMLAVLYGISSQRSRELAAMDRVEQKEPEWGEVNL